MRRASSPSCRFSSRSPSRRAAGDADDIRARLEQWTDDFNAGHAGRRLRPVLAARRSPTIAASRSAATTRSATSCRIRSPTRRNDFHYELEIREIIVEGDLAVVRLTWTLFISPLNITTRRARHGRLPPRGGRQVADHPLPRLRGGTMTHIRRVTRRSNEPAQIRACRVPLPGTISSSRPVIERMSAQEVCREPRPDDRSPSRGGCRGPRCGRAWPSSVRCGAGRPRRRDPHAPGQYRHRPSRRRRKSRGARRRPIRRNFSGPARWSRPSSPARCAPERSIGRISAGWSTASRRPSSSR